MEKVLKRCTKCGDTRLYRPRVRHCRNRKLGKMSYWCYGPLVVERKPVEKAKPQALAQRKLERTRDKIAACDKALKTLARRSARVVRTIRSLEALARRQAVAASMTDDEVVAAREKNRSNKERRELAKRNRKIELEE